MNTCLIHQQQYPQTGYCIYCGQPSSETSKTIIVKESFILCARCGSQVMDGAHVCLPSPTPFYPYLSTWISNGPDGRPANNNTWQTCPIQPTTITASDIRPSAVTLAPVQ